MNLLNLRKKVEPGNGSPGSMHSSLYAQTNVQVPSVDIKVMWEDTSHRWYSGSMVYLLLYLTLSGKKKKETEDGLRVGMVHQEGWMP